MFTTAQLDLLIHTQWGEDWTTEYFPQAVIDASKQFDISGLELETLIAWIETLKEREDSQAANGSDAAGVIFN